MCCYPLFELLQQVPEIYLGFFWNTLTIGAGVMRHGQKSGLLDCMPHHHPQKRGWHNCDILWYLHIRRMNTGIGHQSIFASIHICGDCMPCQEVNAPRSDPNWTGDVRGRIHPGHLTSFNRNLVGKEQSKSKVLGTIPPLVGGLEHEFYEFPYIGNN